MKRAAMGGGENYFKMLNKDLLYKIGNDLLKLRQKELIDIFDSEDEFVNFVKNAIRTTNDVYNVYITERVVEYTLRNKDTLLLRFYIEHNMRYIEQIIEYIVKHCPRLTVDIILEEHFLEDYNLLDTVVAKITVEKTLSIRVVDCVIGREGVDLLNLAKLFAKSGCLTEQIYERLARSQSADTDAYLRFILDNTIYEAAVKGNQLHLIKGVYPRIEKITDTRELTTTWRPHYRRYSDACIYAAKCGYRDVYDWAVKTVWHFENMDVRSVFYEQMCVDSALHGWLDVLQIYEQKIAEKGWAIPYDELYIKAAAAGHIKIIEYLSKSYPLDDEDDDDIRERMTKHAIINGHTHMLDYLKSMKYMMLTTAIIENASCYNRVNVLEWLVHNNVYDNGANHTYYAARYGHLDVLNWLDEKDWTNPGCGIRPIDLFAFAGEYGNLHVIEWGKTKGYYDASEKIAEMLFKQVKNDRFDILKALNLLHLDTEKAKHETPCIRAAEMGRLDILEEAVAAGYKIGIPTCNAAASNGHLHVLKWTLPRVKKGGKSICELGLKYKYFALVKWAHTVGGCPLVSNQLIL